MRLLNTKTFKVKEFYVDVPPYAILSHTWQEEEVTFQDIQRLWVARRRGGWLKVKNACAYAQKYEFEWIWIDSCCIDKSSSAELSEAINSMYQYYEDAEVCYVYLSDASSREDPRDAKSGFRGSRWFTRGWTLQELLAPSHLVILGQDWIEIGTKWSLRDVVSAITSIPVQVFEGRHIDEYSIAQKMSWAAFRQTTRPEDEAYCLMGLFGVSMSPIYGEGGPKAFMRLQQEIIRISEDRSIFAWISSSKDSLEPRGLLAKSPNEFRASGGVGISDIDSIGDKSSFSFNNNGLHIHLPIKPADNSISHNKDLFLASLNCKSKRGRDEGHLFIYLKKINGKRYARCHPDEVLLMSSESESSTSLGLKEIVIQEDSFLRSKKMTRWTPAAEPKLIVYPIQLVPAAQSKVTLVRCEDQSRQGAFLNQETMTLSHPKHLEVHQSLTFKIQSTAEFFRVVIISGKYGSKPSINIIKTSPHGFWDDSPETSQLGDRSYTQLEKGGIVSASLQVTSRKWRRAVEIDYCDNCNTRNNYHVCVAFSSSKMLRPSIGFAIPRFVENDLISLQDIYPADFFVGSLTNTNHWCDEVYISTSTSVDSFGLLTYKYYNNKALLTFHFYVALGFNRDGRAWVDVFTHKADSGQNRTPELIWQSYRKSSSIGQPGGDSLVTIFRAGRGISATILRKRGILQINTHTLLLKSHNTKDIAMDDLAVVEPWSI
ncbi:hypothetical protein VKT23_008007 [Stygiomarasmius scandens]|uniref:Heterokaryon incompatibility domain-containing protein n=1 Tax=Marasmiellus scandens TaxID=2682957 RepID=A0ABR1JJ09_9AGAR